MENKTKTPYMKLFEEKSKETDEILKSSQNKVKSSFINEYKNNRLSGPFCNKDEVYEQLLQYAKSTYTNIVCVSNIHALVSSVGCHHCTIEVLQNLRKQYIFVFFVEEEMNTLHTELDFLLGAKIAYKSRDFQNALMFAIDKGKL